MKKTILGPTTSTFPMPVVLIGTIVNNKANFMNAAWVNIACLRPVSIVVAINNTRYTMLGIEEYKTFSVNVPSKDLLKAVDYCGIYSGEKTDKAELFKIFYGELKTAPLIEECPLNIECKLTNSLNIGTHSLIIGEVTSTHAEDAIVKENNIIDIEKLDPIIYVPSTITGEYHSLGQHMGKAFHFGKEL